MERLAAIGYPSVVRAIRSREIGVTVLTTEQMKRYSEQLALPGMSGEGQKRLLSSSVIILGAEAFAGTTAQFLVEAGVGTITLVDENPKVLATVYRRIAEAQYPSGDSTIVCKASGFDAANVDGLIRDHHVVIDGLMNWQDKLIVSDSCMHAKKPLVHAGGSGFRFQLFTMIPGKSACLRCAFPVAGIDDVPLTPPKDGRMSAVTAMVAGWQAMETVKLLARIGVSQGNELTKVDWLSGEIETIRGLDPRSDCPDCGRTR